MSSVVQTWVNDLPMMQQTVLFTAIRGPDGLPKYGAIKMLLRWYRRCILLSAIDGKVLETPYTNNGGSFTGPSFDFISVRIKPTDSTLWEVYMDNIVSDYIKDLDAIPHHFQLHLIHAIEILGYKHPYERIRNFWNNVYIRLVHDMHLYPEPMEDMNKRLSDSREEWLARCDKAVKE